MNKSACHPIRKPVFVAILLATYICDGRTASAAIRTFSFSGTMQQVPDSISNIVPFGEGTPFTGTLSWDDQSVIDVSSNNPDYRYAFLDTNLNPSFQHSFHWIINGNDFAAAQGKFFRVGVDLYANRHIFSIQCFDVEVPTGWSASGGDPEDPFIQFTLVDDSASAFAGASIPESFDISKFNSNVVEFHHRGGQNGATIVTPLGQMTTSDDSMYFVGTIDSVMISPEPSTFILAIMSGLVAVRISWNGRPRCQRAA